MRWIRNDDLVVILSVAKNLVGPCARSFASLRMTLTIGVLMFLAGCGSGRFPVAGEVTFDGKPVEQGTISFEPADGKGPTTGGKILGGKYEFKGKAAPLPGKKAVRIFAARKTGRQVEVKRSKPKLMVDEIERYIPDSYNTKTTLSCEVADRGTNQIDFHLKSKQ